MRLSIINLLKNLLHPTAGNKFLFFLLSDIILFYPVFAFCPSLSFRSQPEHPVQSPSFSRPAFLCGGEDRLFLSVQDLQDDLAVCRAV